MSTDSGTSKLGWAARMPTPPPPDTAEGGALAFALAMGLIYVLLLVADYNTMTAIAFAVTTLSLLIAVVAGFALAGMLGSDLSTFQRLELELARTVLAYASSGTPPQSDAPLAGVWRAHVAAAEESRRMARAHAYALGLFTIGGLAGLGAALLAGLGVVTATMNVLGLAMVVELFVFVFLLVGVGAIVGTVGYAAPIPFYERVSPRRWRRNAGRQIAVDGAVSEVAWLSEFARGARESKISPRGPSVIPSWRE